MRAPKNDKTSIEAKLDTVIRLLEDLFILEAGRAQMGRDRIRSILKVRTERISKITKRLK